MQTKKQSHLEVITNQCLGLVGGWLIVYYLFPLFDYMEQSTVATISTIIFLLNAASMGVPQRRERVFFVCSRKDLNYPTVVQ